ncbi:hypothetical protein IBX65_07285, partial [Candidatus Aerophobetes bacterium]|nr:hypothetical protein [Candidatus Aerophobetes bacterium]
NPTLTFTVTDALNNLGIAELYIDAYPSTVVDTIALGAVQATTVSVEIDITDLDEGEHTIFIRANDDLGNWSDVAQIQFLVDKTPLLVVVDKILPDPTNIDSVTVTGYVLDSTTPISELKYEVSGAGTLALTDVPAAYITEGTVGTSLLIHFSIPVTSSTITTEGTYTVRVEATDKADNTAEGEDSFIYDATAPDMAWIERPAPGSWISTDTVILIGSASDALTSIATVRYQLDGGDWYLAGSVDGAFDSLYEEFSFTLYQLAESDHTVVVEAVDEAGNVASISTVFYVDTIGPVVTGINVSPDPTNINPTLTFTATDALNNVAVVEYYINTYLDTDPVWRATVFPLLPITNVTTTINIEDLVEGEHIVFARARDDIGNWGDPQQTSFLVDKSRMEIVLTTKPTDPTSDDTPLFEGYAQDSTTKIMEVVYRFKDPVGVYTAWEPVTITSGGIGGLPCSHLVDFEFTPAAPLSPDGRWTMEVRATDEATNVNTISYSFTLDTAEPYVSYYIRTYPKLDVPYGPISGPSGIYYEVYEQTVDITATVSDKTTYVTSVGFERTQGGVTENMDERTNNDKANPWVTTLQVDLAYDVLTTFTITARDQAGNITTVSVTLKYQHAEADVLIGEAVIGEYGGVVEASDRTMVDIPEGALNRQTLISIRKVTRDQIPFYEHGLPECIVGTPFARRFEPEDLVFLKWVTIAVPYTQGWIDYMNADGAGIDENRLALFSFDGLRWNKIESTVDTDANIVTARVNHLGLFRIMEDRCDAPADFTMYLTKNPFAYGDHTVFYYELPQAGTATIKIYDLAGDLVRTLADGEAQNAGYNEATWSGQNDFMNYVGSGIYIFKLHVRFTDGTTKTIIKPVGVIK